MNLRRSQLTRSGLIVENRAIHRFALLRMFGPSPQATLVKYLATTMASADFCDLTQCITARRAACADGSLPVRSQSDRAARSRAWSFRVRQHHAVLPSTSRRHGAQISPGKNANCRCTSAAFTVGCVPVGFAAMCQLASHPSAFYAVSVRRLAPLALRLPPDHASRHRPCLRLVVILAHDESKSVLPQGTFTP